MTGGRAHIEVPEQRRRRAQRDEHPDIDEPARARGRRFLPQQKDERGRQDAGRNDREDAVRGHAESDREPERERKAAVGECARGGALRRVHREHRHQDIEHLRVRRPHERLGHVVGDEQQAGRDHDDGGGSAARGRMALDHLAQHMKACEQDRDVEENVGDVGRPVLRKTPCHAPRIV